MRKRPGHSEEQEEEQQENREQVAEMLRSDGWKIARRSIKKKMDAIARHIAINVRIDAVDLRGKQAQYQLLEKFLQHETALAFFTEDEPQP